MNLVSAIVLSHWLHMRSFPNVSVQRNSAKGQHISFLLVSCHWTAQQQLSWKPYLSKQQLLPLQPRQPWLRGSLLQSGLQKPTCPDFAEKRIKRLQTCKTTKKNQPIESAERNNQNIIWSFYLEPLWRLEKFWNLWILNFTPLCLNLNCIWNLGPLKGGTFMRSLRDVEPFKCGTCGAQAVGGKKTSRHRSCSWKAPYSPVWWASPAPAWPGPQAGTAVHCDAPGRGLGGSTPKYLDVMVWKGSYPLLLWFARSLLDVAWSCLPWFGCF